MNTILTASNVQAGDGLLGGKKSTNHRDSKELQAKGRKRNDGQESDKCKKASSHQAISSSLTEVIWKKRKAFEKLSKPNKSSDFKDESGKRGYFVSNSTLVDQKKIKGKSSEADRENSADCTVEKISNDSQITHQNFYGLLRETSV